MCTKFVVLLMVYNGRRAGGETAKVGNLTLVERFSGQKYVIVLSQRTKT